MTRKRSKIPLPRLLSFETFIGIGLILVLVAFSLRLYQSIYLEFDSVHDGFVLSTAIGLRSGKIPFVGYFGQYGVTADLINASGISLLGWLSAAAAVRLTSLILLMTTFLVFVLGSPHRKNRNLLLSAAALLIALNDISYGVGFFPWANLTSNLCFIGLLVVAANQTFSNKRFTALWIMLLVCLVASRIQFFPLLSLAFIPFISNRKVFRLALGLVVAAGIVTVTIAFNLQVFQLYENFLNTFFGGWAPGYVKGNVWFLFAGASIAISLTAMNTNKFLWLKPLFVGPSVIGLATFLQFGSATSIWVATSTERNTFSVRVLESTYGFGVGFLGVLGLYNLVALFFGRKFYRSILMETTVILIGLAGGTQLVPIPDSRHMWYALVPIVCSIAFVLILRDLPISSRAAVSVLICLLAASIFIQTQNGFKEYLALERKEQSSALIKGMKNSEVTLTNSYMALKRPLDSDFALLQKHLKSDGMAIFLTNDAVFAVFDGKWRSVDRSQVGWDPYAKNLKTRLIDFGFPLVILPILHDEAFVVPIELWQSGYSLVEEGSQISIYAKE